MNRERTILEWTFASDSKDGDAQWKQESAPCGQPLQPHGAITWRWIVRFAVVLGVLIVATGGWFWRTGLVGLAEIEGELQTVVDTEVTLAASMPQLAPILLDQDMSDIWKWTLEREPIPEKSNGPSNATVVDFELHGDVAIVAVELRADQHQDANGTVYRQTRFYRQSNQQWVRTEPVAELWGEQGSLHTENLDFHFRERDALAVAQMAEAIDRIYADLIESLALPAPDAPIRIEVSVTHPPGVEVLLRSPLVVPSPAIYPAPVGVGDIELLARSVALVLLEEVRKQALPVHGMGTLGYTLVDALFLHDLWTENELYADVKSDLIDIVYAGDLSGPLDLEDRGVLFRSCALESRLPRVSLSSYLSLRCADMPRGSGVDAQQRTVSSAPKRLDDFFLFSPAWLKYRQSPDTFAGVETSAEEILGRYAGLNEVVALALLLDYAAETYGEGRLPDLVRAHGVYENWNEVIPAVYGDPAAQFEVGWQAYLHDEYAILID